MTAMKLWFADISGWPPGFLVTSSRVLSDSYPRALSISRTSLVVRFSARRACDESVAIVRQLGAKDALPEILLEQALLDLEEGAPASAHAICLDVLALADEVGNQLVVASALECLGKIEVGSQRPLMAARTFAAANALRRKFTGGRPSGVRPPEESAIAEARKLVGDDAAFDQAWNAGLESPLEVAAEYALRAGAT